MIPCPVFWPCQDCVVLVGLARMWEAEPRDYRLIEVDGARPQFDYMRRLEGAPSERESPGERKFEAGDLEPKAKAKM